MNLCVRQRVNRWNIRYTDDFACSLISFYFFMMAYHFSKYFTYTRRNIHLLRPAQGSYLFLSQNHLRTRFVGKFVWTFRSLFRRFTSSQSPPRRSLSMLAKWNGGQKFFIREFVSTRKWKSMIISDRALKGNGDKRVKEFLSTLQSATSRLEIRECYVWQSGVGRECGGQFNIFCNAGGKLLICLSCQL